MATFRTIIPKFYVSSSMLRIFRYQVPYYYIKIISFCIVFWSVNHQSSVIEHQASIDRNSDMHAATDLNTKGVQMGTLLITCSGCTNLQKVQSMITTSITICSLY